MLNLSRRIDELWKQHAASICADLNISIPKMRIVSKTDDNYNGLCTYETKQNWVGEVVAIGDVVDVSFNVKCIKESLVSFIGVRNDIVDYFILYIMRHELRHCYQVAHEPMLLIKQSRMSMFSSFYAAGEMPAEDDADQYAIRTSTCCKLDELIAKVYTIYHNKVTKKSYAELQELYKQIRKITLVPKIKSAATGAVIGAGLGLAIALLLKKRR